MNLPQALTSLCGLLQRIKSGVRHGIVSAAIMTAGALLLVAAAGFAAAAGYIWLAAQVPDHLAALLVAGGLALTGGIVIAVAVVRSRPRNRHASPSLDTDIAREAEAAADQAVQSVLSEVRIHPLSALMTALVAGVAVGLLKPGAARNPPREQPRRPSGG